MNTRLKWLLPFLYFLFSSQNTFADCTQVEKTVKYKVIAGDHIASVLRYLNQTPVFCRGCSLDQLLLVNKLEDKDLIHPGQELIIPFACEEDLSSFKMASDQDARLIEVPRQFATNADYTELEEEKQQKNNKKKNNNNFKQPGRTTLSQAGYYSASKKERIIFASELDGVKVQNGKNDWTKIDCRGKLVDGGCLVRSNNHYLKIKNNSLIYDFEDHTLNEKYKINSYITPGFEVGLVHYFSYQWSILGYLELMHLSPRSDAYPVDQSKYFFFRGLVDFKYQPNSYFFGVGLRRGEYAYFVPTGVSDEIESNTIFHFRALFGSQWWDSEKDTLTSEFSIDHGSSATGHAIDPGASQILMVKNEYKLKNTDGYYVFGADLSRHDEKSAKTRQAYWDVVLSAGIGWNLKTNY